MNHVHRIASASSADWGAAIERAVRVLAIGLAWLIVATETTYRAGLATGRAVHWASDRLAGLASGRYDRAAAAAATVRWARAVLETPAPASAPAPVVITQPCRPAAEPARSVAPMVAELRRLARERGFSALARSGRRAELLEALGIA